MKAVLVIDLPDDFLADPSNAYRLHIGGDAKVYYVRDGEKRGSIVGDTRALRPMPRKKNKDFHPNIVYANGWNACIEEIEGEGDETIQANGS